MKRGIALIVFWASIIPIFAQGITGQYLSTDIRDLVLIYQGGAHRMDFTVDEIRPYVVHENRFGKRDWLFDGFLYVEYDSGRGVSFENRDGAPYSHKDDWLWLIDRQFAPGKGICALEDCIEQEIANLGTPPFKHRVVIAIPEPPLDQSDWGELNGRKLDFRNDYDRVTACNWYIDLVKERFDSLKFKNIELSGFYWISEKALQSQYVTPLVSQHIHDLGYLFYWIPYYGAVGYSQWRQFGFDAAYIQPTYFWNKKYKPSRLDYACELARNHGMGLEMEFDLAASVKSEKQLRSRAFDYISAFRRNGAYRDASLAYYEGGAGIYYFNKMQDSADKEFIDTIAWFVQSRRSNRTSHDVSKSFKYGTVTVELKIKKLKPQSKITVALLPENSKLGSIPNSGEIYMMKLIGDKPSEVAVGVQTMQNNDSLHNTRETVIAIDKIIGKKVKLQCCWYEGEILFYLDGHLVNVQEDLYDSTKPYYPQGWPFNHDNFYFDISTEGDANIEVKSILITPF